MLYMLRRVLVRPGRVPDDPFWLTGPGRLEDVLFEEFLSAAYPADPPSRRYHPTAVRHWLTFLAFSVANETGDVVWWRIHRLTPNLKPLTGSLVGLLSGMLAVLFGVLVQLAATTSWRVADGLRSALPFGVIVGILIGFLVAAVGDRARLFRVSRRAVTAGVSIGLAVGSSVVVVLWSAVGVGTALALGVPAALLSGLTAGVGVGHPVNGVSRVAATSPMTTWRNDRDLACAVAVSAGLVCGLPMYLLAGVWIGASAAVIGGTAMALIVADWPWLMLSQAVLAGRGHLPWALLRFLEDARRRGLLRQSGGFYQFRHDRLRRHLIEQRGQKAGTRDVARQRGPADDDAADRATAGGGAATGSASADDPTGRPSS
jgi:hypothetical protein